MCQLGEAIDGGAARRYALVNRALKDGSLVRLKRGTYLLGKSYRSDAIHPFAVAQALIPGSYVSFETALAHHGWIPEAVYATASVTPGRKTLEFDTPVMGRFTFTEKPGGGFEASNAEYLPILATCTFDGDSRVMNIPVALATADYGAYGRDRLELAQARTTATVDSLGGSGQGLQPLTQ